MSWSSLTAVLWPTADQGHDPKKRNTQLTCFNMCQCTRMRSCFSSFFSLSFYLSLLLQGTAKCQEIMEYFAARTPGSRVIETSRPSMSCHVLPRRPTDFSLRWMQSGGVRNLRLDSRLKSLNMDHSRLLGVVSAKHAGGPSKYSTCLVSIFRLLALPEDPGRSRRDTVQGWECHVSELFAAESSHVA